uniref:Group XV phospholipase A2 n=1 Tax=Aceria tosichella TaxID=561515 RepID=A0A6G1SLI2_9ACAR
MRPTKSYLKQISLKKPLLTGAILFYCLVVVVQYAPSVSSQSLSSLVTSFFTDPQVKPQTSFRTIKENVNRSPIVFIPGDGGSQLQAKLNKTTTPHYLCATVSDWFDLWLNLHLLAPIAIDCLFDNFSLHYDNKTRTTNNTEGVQIRPTNFGSLDSVDYLDIKHLPGTTYFDSIIVALENNNGYVANADMVGAPFDFRKAPNELAEFFDDLKNLIENHYIMNNYRPVTLICHSMGCLNSLYLLNRQTDNWKEVYVRRLISLAAPWGGSFKAISAMLYGDDLGIPLLSHQKLQKLQSSFPSLMYLFPREPTFNRNRILVETPTNNYTLENLDKLFVDANLLDQREMWLDTKEIASNLKAPNVELWCLYGVGSATPTKIIYKDSFNSGKYSEVEGDGDGTVNLDSLRACEYFGDQQEKPVYTRMFRNVDHIGILRGSEAASFISTFILKDD